MADLGERVEAELQNIRKVLGGLRGARDRKPLSVLELAGAGALLHSFYNGIENVLKQMFRAREVRLPAGPAWHRALLKQAQTAGIISDELCKDLRAYLAFRHFFSHGYAVDLLPAKMEPLVQHAAPPFRRFEGEVRTCLGAKRAHTRRKRGTPAGPQKRRQQDG